MKLNKRYTRNIRENLSFYIASTVLTIVTLLMYFLFNIAGNAILEFGDGFFSRNKVEDAHFTTYMPIPDKEISKLENKYDITLEKQNFINIDTNGVTARVFKKTKNIDLYEITVGEDAKHDDEIVISEGFAVNMKKSVGDIMKIGKKNYKIVGFMQRPDYLYMLENVDDSYKNISSFYLAYMTDNEFDRLGETSCQYLVRYNKDNSTDFRKAIHKSYYMHEYLGAKDNMRIEMVDYQAQMFVIMSYIILCVLPLIAVALVSIIISRKVKSEQKMIGTLSALGYKKGQLMRHYAGFAAIPGIIGGILTSVLAAVFAQPYSELGLADYEPMRIVGHLNPIAAVLGVIVPTAMYVLAALISVRKLLKKDTVMLLSGNADGSSKKRKRILAKSKISFRIKYAIRSIVGSPARSLVVFLGIFLGAFIMLFGFAMIDTASEAADSMGESVGSYQHQYILNELSKKNSYGGEKMLVSSMEMKDNIKLMLIGTSDDNPYLDFRDANSNDVKIGDKYYITSLASLLYGIKDGDKAELYNPITLEKKKITVSGVIQNDVQKAIITSMKKAAELSGLEEGTFNTVISDKRLDIPESKIAQETSKTDIKEQVNTMMDQMGMMIGLLVGLGIIICVASIYVAVNMLVTENRSNISMLKVLGYRDRQIDRIVLDVNHIFLPLGLLLSIPATISVGNLYFVAFADVLGMLIKTYISPKSYILVIILTTACYAASLLMVRRKIKKVNMIESLKDNRE